MSSNPIQVFVPTNDSGQLGLQLLLIKSCAIWFSTALFIFANLHPIAAHPAVAFTYGPTKIKREKEKYSRMLFYSLMLRGQLRFVSSDIAGARSDFEKMSIYANANAPEYFLHRCMKLINLDSLHSETLRTCKKMLYECKTENDLDNFVQSLEYPKKYCVLPTASDQSFFLSCYAFRKLKVYTSDYSDESLLSFWGMLTSPKKNFLGLQYSCTDPVILTTLFNELQRNSRLFNSPLPSSFLLLYEACTRDNKAGSSERECAEQVFFTKCRSLTQGAARYRGGNQ